MKPKKVLILTYYWPPAGGAGVQRWLKFTKYLSLLGYEPHVYTAENPEAPANDSSLLQDVPENAIIIKKPIWEPFGIYKKITNKKGNFNAGFLTEENENKTKWTEKASMFVRANVFVPDAKMFWIPPSVKFLKAYIIKNNIELVISSGPPHSLHLIALKLKGLLNIKWLADFRDPWTNIDFYQKLPMLSIVDKRQHSLEKEVLERADKILVVGEEMRKEFANKISLKEKIHVITNGYDTPIRTKETLEKDFTIVHIGSINADRSHESFYKAISMLLSRNTDAKKRFKIKLIGKVDYIARLYIIKYHLENIVEFISYLPYNQISEIQERAHLLYLPINNTPNAKGILTGKFFEYLAARRFILAQGPVDGNMSAILNEMKSGEIFDFSDTEGVFNMLDKHFSNYQNKGYAIKSGNIEKYSRKNLTKQLSGILDSI
ncbi:MAG: glycosyltransferase family 4 protein [Bacteroidales bacterium]|nr:glycosyltransferase family 4 protein [Bacteroidales bacterium]